jgi:hypothetical protein
MKGNAEKALEATEEIVGLGLVVVVDERLLAPTATRYRSGEARRGPLAV